MKYSDLNLSIYDNTVNISITPDCDINVLMYLPIEDKNDIIHLALQNSEENGTYNLLKLKMYFEMYIMYLYTDMEFTLEEKGDPVALYDILKSTGIIESVIDAIPGSEYTYLKSMLEETMKMKLKHRNTIAAVLNSFIENLPKNAEEAMDIVNKFNPEDFQQVLAFAKAANGGREIN